MAKPEAIAFIVETLGLLDAKFEGGEGNFRLALSHDMFTTVTFDYRWRGGAEVRRRAVTVVFRGGADVTVSVQYTEDMPLDIIDLARWVGCIAQAVERCRVCLVVGG